MAQLADYTIDHSQVDWSDLLANWAWLLPPRFTVWVMSRFGDLFLVLEDGSVHMLDAGRGSLEPVAHDREHFASRIDEPATASEWFMIPLVDALTHAGVSLRPGECYSYVSLPVLGGEYSILNTRVVPIATHYKAFGPLHETLRNIPDGTAIEFVLETEDARRRRTRS